AGLGPFALMLASACVYHGAMALNDWADRAEDARSRSGRPIPSGAIGARTALALAATLLASGPLLALAVAPRCGLLLAAVAGCAALYDLAGRGPWLGPLLLGLCRAGNLGLGLAFASTLAPVPVELRLAPLAYGLYVFLVSRLARLEDLEPARYERGEVRPTPWVVAAGAALLGIGALATWLATLPREPAPWPRGRPEGALLLTALGAFGLFRGAWAFAGGAWRAGDVQRLAGMGLRRLLVA